MAALYPRKCYYEVRATDPSQSEAAVSGASQARLLLPKCRHGDLIRPLCPRKRTCGDNFIYVCYVPITDIHASDILAVFAKRWPDQ
jgi:hypothetical protein